jgi:hypothetical protein
MRVWFFLSPKKTGIYPEINHVLNHMRRPKDSC